MNPPLSFKVNLEALKRHLGRIVGERNFETSPKHLLEVQHYIEEEFRGYGFEVARLPFTFRGQTFVNLKARRPGAQARRRFIIGAHFDSVPGSPGADDNASGVASLLEVARGLATAKMRETNVEFIAFNLEEYGMIGSRAYAEQLKKEKAEISGMLSLEMVGYSTPEKNSQKMPLFLKPFYPDTGNFIGLVANTSSKKFLQKTRDAFKQVEGLAIETLVLPANGWVFPDARLSDHSPFWDNGFPALLVTDTSFFRNPYYHSKEDRIETLNLPFLARVTEAVFQTAWSFEAGQEEQRQSERKYSKA
jgi:Zn-dependent M28 family amino/carboxypeptidase